ncbi:MAG: hypothetical protein U9N85_00090 [Bacteroidota bacterium]|nr:hypothetical protein [Bacteroidota bacterium]
MLSGYTTSSGRGLAPPATNDTIIINDTVFRGDTIVIYQTVKITETYRDTVLVFDTVQYRPDVSIQNSIDDTLREQTNTFKKPVVESPYSLTLLGGPLYSAMIFKPDFLYENLAASNNNAHTGIPSYQIQIGGEYSKGLNTVETGVNYLKMAQKFTMPQAQFAIDTLLSYNYFFREELQIDTIWFINIDTLLATGDTLWVAYEDSNYVSVPDSIQAYTTDTTKVFKNFNSKNTYRFIEIPLIFGHSFRVGKHYVSTKFGIISSFFVNSKGNLVSLDDGEQPESISGRIKKSPIIYSYYIAAGTKFYINRQFDFVIDAFYRGSINSMFNDYPIILQNRMYGLRMGISYKIHYR